MFVYMVTDERVLVDGQGGRGNGVMVAAPDAGRRHAVAVAVADGRTSVV